MKRFQLKIIIVSFKWVYLTMIPKDVKTEIMNEHLAQDSIFISNTSLFYPHYKYLNEVNIKTIGTAVGGFTG